MNKPNVELRNFIKDRHIPMYQLAEFLGIAESTLYTRFRHPMTDDQQKEICEAVEDMARS